MDKKINVGIFLGGKSVEHQVSLLSAKNVLNVIDRSKYLVRCIGIDPQGKRYLYKEENLFCYPDDPEKICLGEKKELIDWKTLFSLIDVAFPVLHGNLGEDGAIQGVFKWFDIPFVGASILGSSIGMDKDVMKRLVRDAKIPIPKFICLTANEKNKWTIERVSEILGSSFFVKPTNGGSSLGMTRVDHPLDFQAALDLAFEYHHKILIEETIQGREIEFSLLGNENPQISCPCEIIPTGKYHSYTSKYVDPSAAEFVIPAKMDPFIVKKMQILAKKAYQILCCQGMARIDLFLTEDNQIYFNEINTLPGLTNMSPFAKMWRASGLEDKKLIEQLIQLAFDRQTQEKNLKTQLEMQWAKQ